MTLPLRLHHYAWVTKDHEANRRFFEDVLGIPLVATWCERAHVAEVGRELEHCHAFYGLADGGAIAFFQFADLQRRLTPDELKLEFTLDPDNVDDIARRRKADAHAELKRWLAGDRTPNNADHKSVFQ